MVIGVTGPRKLTDEQAQQAAYELWEIWNYGGQTCPWLVGCAAGLDELARQTCESQQLTLYTAAGRQPWQLQARSKRLVEALAAQGGTLHAWPNKPCPAGLTAKSWKGSGTWGTVAYAKQLGVKVELHPLTEGLELPDWWAAKQMSLA